MSGGGKRLITDRDVATGAVRPPLVLGGDTLITPSARDRAVRLGWTIVEDGAAIPGAPAAMRVGAACARCGRDGCRGECATCGAGAAGAAAGGSGSARLDALADGLYLVRVEGGQMVSALPASGPGVMQRSIGARRIAGDATRDAAAGARS